MKLIKSLLEEANDSDPSFVTFYHNLLGKEPEPIQNVILGNPNSKQAKAFFGKAKNLWKNRNRRVLHQ